MRRHVNMSIVNDIAVRVDFWVWIIILRAQMSNNAESLNIFIGSAVG